VNGEQAIACSMAQIATPSVANTPVAAHVKNTPAMHFNLPMELKDFTFFIFSPNFQKEG
jgi:hypothetical protein